MKIKMESVEAVIVTLDYMIEATCYLHPMSRFSDFINSSNRDYIPATNVRLFSRATTALLGTVDFMAVNKAQILFIYPQAANAKITYERMKND